MRQAKKTFNSLCLLLIAILLAGCQASGSSTDVPWKTFASQECRYRFQYPGEVRVEVIDKHAVQIKVHTQTGEPFQFTCAREYSPGDTLYYLDTAPIGERQIGENAWSEFRLPDGYCDAAGCSPPLYALRMEVDEVLYTVTFYAQDTTTEGQEEILSTLHIGKQP